MNVSLTILLSTIGRVELHCMLNSLKDQLDCKDYLYIIIDGIQNYCASTEIVNKYKFKCNVNVICEDNNLGYWGHPIRNKYQKNILGDYIINADDDDIFLFNSISLIKTFCNSKNELKLFRFYENYNKKKYIWRDQKIYCGNIGTPCGLIPNIPEKMGFWEHKRGGDFSFYNTCSFSNINFIDKFIYCVKPNINGCPKDSLEYIK